MVTINKRLCAFVFCLTIVAFASPTFARQSHSHISDARAKAIHECNVRAAKYNQYTWGVTEITTYRTCMAEHGEQE